MPYNYNQSIIIEIIKPVNEINNIKMILSKLSNLKKCVLINLV